MTERLALEIYKDGWTGQLQVAINFFDGSGSDGYRIAGPKFNGSGTLLLRKPLTDRDAEEIRRYLDRVFPLVNEGVLS